MIYKVVELASLHTKSKGGARVTIPPKATYGVGEFIKEDDKTYSLVCCVEENIGTLEQQRAYAQRISNALNVDLAEVVQHPVG